MSILKQTSTDGPLPKRRKLSNDAHIDVRFGEPPQSDSDSEDSKLKVTGPGATGKPGRQSIPRRANGPSAVPTGGLNKSSILSIQLNDLVTDNTPRYDKLTSEIDADVKRIAELIRSAQKAGPLGLKDAEALVSKDGVSIPFPSPKPGKDTNLKFEYDKPISVTPISALHLKLSIKGTSLVKIVAEMPKHLLQEKDYLNYRAFHKRAFYLARIAGYINKEASKEFDVQCIQEGGVKLLPALMLTPKSETASVGRSRKQRQTMIVAVSFPQDAFGLEKTLPTRNCVRPKDGLEDTKLLPTPYYNSVLNSQMVQPYYYELIQKAMQDCAAFGDACRAGQVWLRQRGLDGDMESGGFGYWEWAVISALLLQTGGHKGHSLFSARYSSLQLFKAMLQVISGRDLTDPWTLHASTLSIPRSDSPTFYDGKTGVNVLHKLTPWAYQSLRHHALTSLAAVNSKQDQSFDATFDLRVAEPRLQFDEMYTVSVDTVDHDMDDKLIRMYAVLKRGLGDRVILLQLQTPSARPWPVNKSQPRSTRTKVELALLLNIDAISRLIDHGPSADELEEAADFRTFWGEKSELRRFKDGTICESLIWSASTPVTEQIISWLMKRHLGALQDTINTLSPQLEDRLLEPESSITATEAFKILNNQFQTLSTTLHQLDGLPLPIRSISPTDPALCSSTLHHPLTPSSAEPIGVLIQFDSSTRWPDSLPAIQHTKIAFLLKLAELLSTADASLTTRVGLENTSSQHSGYLNTSYLDIIYPPPHTNLSHVPFRLRIHHDRELPLLQVQLTKSLAPSERTLLASALTTHKRILASHLHTTTMRTLTTRFPPLSPTVRLLKSFIAAHSLTTLLPPPLLEILSAHIFLHPAPWSTPASPTTAFLRVLYFLSRWDWSVSPLIVDLSLSQDMSDSIREELKTRFTAWRKLDPLMNNVSWFVGTSIDATGVVWVEGGRVEKVVAGRVQALAGAVVELVSSKGRGMSEADWEGIFSGEVGEFDFILQVERDLVRGLVAKDAKKKMAKGRESKSKFKNLVLAEQQIQSTDDIGFDPVALYLADLQKSFGHVALFFYGEGQDVIGGLWRPAVLGEKEWRVRLGWSSVPLRYRGGEDGRESGEKDVVCGFNREGVLAEIGMMGEGIVKEIKVKE